MRSSLVEPRVKRSLFLATCALVSTTLTLVGGSLAQDVAKEPKPEAKQERGGEEQTPGQSEKKGESEGKPEAPAAPAQPPTEPTKSTTPPSKRAPGEAKKQSATAGTTKQGDQSKRLEEIERTLRSLLEEVQALKGQPEKVAKKDATPEYKGIVPADWLKLLAWRPIGPANMGGRIVDLAVCPTDPSIFWVATASGGLLKTTNNGVTFEHQFDKEATVSIGAVAVAPSDPAIVWVGTGENNPRNSVSYGDGVYKSTDGGKSWKNMGLNKTFQIGRIVVHPTDPNIVYVGALGRLYGSNPDRGLFKTTDGGQTWQKVLFIDDETGVIDLSMHPAEPDTLIVATWERKRDGFDSWPGTDVKKADGYDGYDPIKKWGPGTGLHKTTDGGKTWKKLTKGLPTNNLGRIGLDWYRKDPNIVLAVIDCENTGKGPQPLQVYLGTVGQDIDGKPTVIQIMPDSPAAKAGVQIGDVVNAIGDKTISEFDQLLDVLRERKPGDKIKLKLTRGEETKEFELELGPRPGTRQFAGGFGPSGPWLGAAGEQRDARVQLTFIAPDSPADKAGLETGDIITDVEGKPISEFEQLTQEVRARSAGDKITLRIARRDETKEIEVTIEDRPSSFAQLTQTGQGGVYMGIVGEDAEAGARLTQITDEGPAQKAGLETGDIITAIEAKPISGYSDLVEAIRRAKAGDKLKLTVRRRDETKELVVTLEERGGATRSRPYSYSLGGQSPNVQDQQGAKGFEFGGIYKSVDAGDTWTRVNSLNSRPMYFSQIRVDPSDDRHIYVLGVQQFRSANGGLTFQGDFGRGVHADGHALWIDPRDGRHMVLGTDGGTYVTYDRGTNWDHLNHTAIAQFYHVAISPKEPYYVTGGLQDNGTWFGPSLSKNGSGPVNEDWLSVSGGDGFMCRVDPDEPDLVYFTSQDGNMGRRNLRTGERASIRPQRPRGEPAYRFNWNTPFILSNANSRIFYCAGNYVFRSLNRGDNLTVISPEITHTKRGSATALAESPKNSSVLYVGTDDGALWVTRDGGREWKEISKNVGLPTPRWISTIEPSHFEEGRVYVVFDGHRSDDDEPYVFVSDDFGEKWQSLRANLPWGSTRCLREDFKNQDLLVLGTEFGVWFSIDRGKYWNKMNSNLPTVAVHEIALHPNNGELVAATHGRSLWICDVSAIRQIKPENLNDKIALYEPSTTIRWQREPSRGRTNRQFVGTNPPAGAQIYYSLPKKAGQVSMRIVDVEGKTVRELRASNNAGLHRVTWDLSRAAQQNRSGRDTGGQPPGRRSREGAAGESSAAAPAGGSPPAAAGSTAAPQEPQAASQAGSAAAGQAPRGTSERSGPPRFGPGLGGFGGGRPAPPGTYRIVLNVDGQEFAQVVRIDPDPNAPANAAADAFEEPGEDEDHEEHERYERRSSGEHSPIDD